MRYALTDRESNKRPATIASSVGGELASGTGSRMGSVPLTTRRFR